MNFHCRGSFSGIAIAWGTNPMCMPVYAFKESYGFMKAHPAQMIFITTSYITLCS